eukprot:1711969-Pyramimonas_sp.AAC.1
MGSSSAENIPRDDFVPKAELRCAAPCCTVLNCAMSYRVEQCCTLSRYGSGRPWPRAEWRRAGSSRKVRGVQPARARNPICFRISTNRHGGEGCMDAPGDALGDVPRNVRGDRPWTCQGPATGHGK